VTETTDWQGLEAAALDAALETRRHIRRCPVCTPGGELCATGDRLLAATNRGLGQLGDRMAARGRVAAALRA
jgi:hypothetical protein